MSTPHHALQDLLQDLLAASRPVDPARLSQLEEPDWDRLLSMVRQHRLGPLLHWRLGHERKSMPTPARFAAVLAAQFRKSALRALALQRELLHVHRVLTAANIPCVGLKGAYLAFHSYPHPALRPLRDLDLLVPEPDALRAHEVLLAAGYRRLDNAPGKADAALAVDAHLPPLRAPSGQVHVELHMRLHPAPAAGADSELWQRLIHVPVAGEQLAFLSATDLLLHLIIHAAYQHRLNNGPLVLSDLAYLIRREAIDWPSFWRRAEAGGWARGCVLLLAMVEHYYGSLALDRPNGSRIATPDNLSLGARLMLCDFDSRVIRGLKAEFANERSPGGVATIVMKKLFPSRKAISARLPVAADSPWVFAYYPANWWRLTAKYLRQYAANKEDRQFNAEVSMSSRFERLLHGDGVD